MFFNLRWLRKSWLLTRRLKLGGDGSENEIKKKTLINLTEGERNFETDR